MFIWYNSIFACFLAGANPCWGLVKVARISVGITYELCRQYSEFQETKLVSRTSAKQVSGPIKNLNAEVRWSRCVNPVGRGST
ncbi:unnamed protein product [Allacma fusca]|uniref:Secreted protein n=1 Tax=Allacma fusca TaxID=39272 RepID=A0A8J2JGJ9_9HEXA|nr:unnamed protein product [Allacma fusca]